MEDIAAEASKAFEPEIIWPEHTAAEGDEPVDDLGKWQNNVQSIEYRPRFFGVGLSHISLNCFM